jgi:hypothetical protein
MQLMLLTRQSHFCFSLSSGNGKIVVGPFCNFRDESAFRGLLLAALSLEPKYQAPSFFAG